MKKAWLTFRFLPDEGLLPPVQIYGAWLRFWHWINSLIIAILCVTGYLIGTPLPASLGDTSSLYFMGWIRFIHLASGYLFALLSIARLVTVFIEKRGTHLLFLPPFWRRSWLEGLLFQIRWNLLLEPKARRYLGLNPLANVTMVFMYLLPGALLLLTGFAMYAEVAGHDSWQYAMFGWVTLLWGNTLDLHVVHRLAMWVLVWFSIMHLHITVRDDMLGRQTLVSSMIAGERLFRK
jgi:Ni/Fe-hydrogenase 1 B-type cytochrome subunit